MRDANHDVVTAADDVYVRLGGMGLQHLLQEAGFAEKPEMSIIVKRPARPTSARGQVSDPYVDDVLDALRALCA